MRSFFLYLAKKMEFLDGLPLALTLKNRHDRQQTNSKMTEKMPTLRKIKRAASRHTSQRFCSTFNFAQPHPKPTHHPTSKRLTL